MTRQEIEAKISTIRNNNALPEKQKGMLLDKYEKMLVDATIGDSNAGKIAPAKEKKARAPRTPKPKTKSISLQDFGRMTGIEVTDMTPKVSSKKEVEPDCDDLFEQDRERKAKAAIAAEKRRNAPKKTEATKNTEAVEKASAKVEKSVEKRIKSGDVSVAEIKKIIEEYETALKKLRQLLTRAEGKMKFGGPVKDEDISKLADKARDISNHHCGCNDKHENGGSMYAGGGAIKIGDRVKSTTFKGISGTILSKNKAGYYFVRLDETLPNGDYQHEVLRIDEVEKMSDGGSMYAGGGVAEGGDFLESKGYKYPREVYFDLDGDSYQVTQAQKGLKDVAIYYYTHSFENPISKEVLNKFSKDFGNDFTITLFTNAGVDLHSSSKGKYKNITVKRISGNTYAGGGDTNEIVLTKPKDFVGKVLKNKKQIGTYRISASNRGTVYQVRLANETITFNNEKQIVKHLSQDQYAGGGNTERDAIEFFTDGGIGMKYIVNGKFDSVKFKTDMITRTSKPNAESTIKIWGREMGMNVSKYIDGEIIENIDFANDSTNRAKELFMAFNKKMATGGSMPKGWKHKMK